MKTSLARASMMLVIPLGLGCSATHESGDSAMTSADAGVVDSSPATIDVPTADVVASRPHGGACLADDECSSGHCVRLDLLDDGCVGGVCVEECGSPASCTERFGPEFRGCENDGAPSGITAYCWHDNWEREFCF